MKRKALAIVLALVLALTVSACGKKKYAQAQCVDNFGNIVDPALCYKYQNDYGSHVGDASWLGAVPYRWGYGGRLDGTRYVGGSYGNVYDPLPKQYRAVNQKTYAKSVKKATGQTPTTLNKPITTKPSQRPVGNTPVTASKPPATSPPITSGSSNSNTKTTKKSTKTTTKK
jgi:hypothetical protein